MTSVTDVKLSHATTHQEQQYLNIKWREYKVTILTLALKIYRSGWEPDAIVCIGRGGMEVGDALSRLFKKTLGVIMASSYDGGSQGTLTTADYISITQKISGRILLADDLVDSGSTLACLKRSIKVQYPDVVEVKTAVIYRKTCTKFSPDYYGEVIQEGVWIVLPNEIFDSIPLHTLSKSLLNEMPETALSDLAKGMLAQVSPNPRESIDPATFDQLALTLKA